MSDLAQLGIEVQPHGIDDASSSLDRLAESADRAAKATDVFADSASKVKTATGQMAAGAEMSTSAMVRLAGGIGALVGGAISLGIKAFDELTKHIDEFVKGVIQAGIESERSATVLRVVGTAAGWTSTQMDTIKKSLESVNVVGADANQTMIRLAQVQLSAASATKLGAVASDIAAASGKKTSEVALLVANSIATGNQRAFFGTGIHVNFNEALKAEAKTLGTHVTTLTLAQAAEARWNAITQATVGLLGAHTAALATASVKAEDLSAKWTLLKEAIGEAILPAVKTVIDAVAGAIAKLTPIVEKASESFSSFIHSADMQKVFSALNSALSDVWGILKDVGSAMMDVASSPLAEWTEHTLITSFVTLLDIFGEFIPLLKDMKGGFDDIAASPFGKWLSETLPAAFKFLLSNLEQAIYETQVFANVVGGLLRMGNSFLNMGISGKQTNEQIQQIAKETDARTAQIVQNYALRNVDWSKTQSPQRGTTATAPTPRAPPGSVPVPGGGGVKTPTDKSEEEIQKAIADELKARLALTKDINEVADIKHQEVAAELAKNIAAVETDKHISAAAKATIIAIDQKTASEKNELIDREMIAGLNKQTLEHTKNLNDMMDRQASAQAVLSPFAEETAALEESILASKQKQEMAEKVEADRLVMEAAPHDAQLALDKKQEEDQLKITQALESQAKALTDRIAVIKQNAQFDEDTKQIQVDVLQSQQDAAQTELQRYEIGKQILAAQQEIARDKAQEVLDEAQARETEHDTLDNQKAVSLALSQQAALVTIQANETKAATGTLTNNINDVSSSFLNLEDAIKAHDWAKVFSSIESVITSVVKAFDSLKSTIGSSSSGSASSGGGTGIIGSLGKFVGGLFGGGGGLGGGIGSLAGIGGGSLSLATSSGFGLGSGGLLGSAGTAAGGLAGGLGGILGSVGSLLGPIGAGVGLISSLFGGLFGGGAKKDQARRDAEDQAAEQKNQAAQQIADEQRSLELRLITASGDAAATAAAQRQLELNSISSTNKALAEQVQDAEQRLERSKELTSVEIDLLNLQGNAQGALDRQRQEDIKSIDLLIQPLVRLQYAADDAKTALDTATTNLQNATNVLQTALNTAAQNTAQAETNLRTAYQTQLNGYQDVINKMKDFSSSLHDFLGTLTTAAPGMSPQNAYLAAQAQFQDVSARTQTGTRDERALALSQYQGIAQAFLQASQSYNGIGPAFTADLDAVKKNTLDAANRADLTVTNAQHQIDILNQVVGQSININANIITTGQAIMQLQTARDAENNARTLAGPLFAIDAGVVDLNTAVQNYLVAFNAFTAAQATQAQAINALAVAVATAKGDPANQPVPAGPGLPSYTSTNGDYAAYVEGNPDLKAAFAKGTGYARGRTEAEFGSFHWATIGSTEGRSVRPYAMGGEFTVGGSGGTDSQFVGSMMTPGEHVSVRTPAQMARDSAANDELIGAVKELSTRLDLLLSEAKSDKTSRAYATNQLAGKLDEVTEAVGGVKRSVRKAK